MNCGKKIELNILMTPVIESSQVHIKAADIFLLIIITFIIMMMEELIKVTAMTYSRLQKKLRDEKYTITRL